MGLLSSIFGNASQNTSSQANTTNTTHNTTTNTDNSFMLGDGSFGMRGNGNVIDQSAINTSTSNTSTSFSDSSYKSNDTTFTDNSNRSQFTSFSDLSSKDTTFTDNSVRASSTNFADARTSSTTFTDSSVRDSNNVSTSSTNYSSTTTDFGSVRAALDGIGQVSQRSISGAGDMLSSSLGNLRNVSSDNLQVIKAAFDFAGKTAVSSNNSMADAFGFAQNSIDKSAQAFDNAATAPDNKNIKWLAGAVAAIAVAAFMFKGAR